MSGGTTGGRGQCWACNRDIDGPMSYTLQLDERWKDSLGSGIHVTLDSACAQRVRALLYEIQDAAAPDQRARGQEDDPR